MRPTSLKARFTIELLIECGPQVTFSAHEVENLVRRLLQEYGMVLFDLTVRKQMVRGVRGARNADQD